ncbi:MAG: branched-chain amino acid ABC transporter permease [Actinomycetota bacterium]
MSWSSIFDNTFSAFFGVDAMVYAIAAIGLNVQFGYTGLLNFGQAGFMACGAYGLGMTAHYFQVSFWWGIVFGLVFAVILGLIMGVPTLRLRADYLAIVTIAVAEVIRLVVRSVTFKKYFGGSDGINQFSVPYRKLNPYVESDYPMSIFKASTIQAILLVIAFALMSLVLGSMMRKRLAKTEIFTETTAWIAGGVGTFLVLVLVSTKVTYKGYSLWSITTGWVLTAVLATFVWALMRSPWGRVLKGIREDEDAVRSLGKSVYSYKMQALILGGVIATFAGMMLSLDRGSVQPDNYSRDVTFYVLTALVLGGVAKVSGSIVGPMLFWGLLAFVDSFLNELVSNGHKIPILVQSPNQVGPVRLMVVGILLILLMVYRPQGLFGNRKEMALDGR